jgi:1-acyl-sn-glycerol-3-phosphate acyltransferase
MAERPKKPPASTPVGRTPSAAEIAAAKLLLDPWQWLTAPEFHGVDNVPTRRPFLLVGNHTLMGVLDVPLLVLGLYERRGVFVRSLADHLHFRVPLWRDLLTGFGAIDGTPENCRALMRAGESILVFPGGGREVFKHKGEKYKLIWKNRIGFVRLALEFGYPIVPFAAVGAEECYDIVVDSDELRQSPIGPLIERLAPRVDEIPPIVRGLGPLPRPQRFYFWFGRPIATAAVQGRQDDEAVCLSVRAKVQSAINHGIARLIGERRRDPQRALGARVFGRPKA